MAEVAKKQNIVSQWIVWQFFDVPRNILNAWKNFLRFNLNYFSVPLLLKTLFYPWRRYQMSYGKGFDIGRYFSAFFSNLIFRILGALIRSVLIIVGLIVEAFIFVVGLVLFLGWLILPALLIAGFIFGIWVFF